MLTALDPLICLSNILPSSSKTYGIPPTDARIRTNPIQLLFWTNSQLSTSMKPYITATGQSLIIRSIPASQISPPLMPRLSVRRVVARSPKYLRHQMALKGKVLLGISATVAVLQRKPDLEGLHDSIFATATTQAFFAGTTNPYEQDNIRSLYNCA